MENNGREGFIFTTKSYKSPNDAAILGPWEAESVREGSHAAGMWCGQEIIENNNQTTSNTENSHQQSPREYGLFRRVQDTHEPKAPTLSCWGNTRGWKMCYRKKQK